MTSQQVKEKIDLKTADLKALRKKNADRLIKNLGETMQKIDLSQPDDLKKIEEIKQMELKRSTCSEEKILAQIAKLQTNYDSQKASEDAQRKKAGDKKRREDAHLKITLGGVLVKFLPNTINPTVLESHLRKLLTPEVIEKILIANEQLPLPDKKLLQNCTHETSSALSEHQYFEYNAISATCPKCEGMMVVKSGRYGKYIGCTNYPSCKHTTDFRE